MLTVETTEQVSEDDLLQLAASVEWKEHPLASAIVARTRLQPLPVEGFQSTTGKGVAGVVSGKRVALGNEALLTELAITPSSNLASRVSTLRSQGQTVVFVAIDGIVNGIIGVADPIKASAPEAIRNLRTEGLNVIMLSGDSKATADAVAKQLDILTVIAEVSPDEKSNEISRLKNQGYVVAMAGDGVNDAPALATADVGIAMGSATDVAMQSSGITLVKGDLSGIVRARRLSVATMRNIRQNLFFAFVYNALGVPLAAGILFPIFGILLSPMIASAAMTFSSVSVIANALRLRSVQL